MVLFLADHYTILEDKSSYAIPAEEFERIVLPYYNIDIETFQALARYDAEGNYYPWRPLNTNDFVLIWYYNVDPEVTAYAVNPDGTMTLTVEMLSTDLRQHRINTKSALYNRCQIKTVDNF